MTELIEWLSWWFRTVTWWFGGLVWFLLALNLIIWIGERWNKKMTNYERIKAMSVEEMAELLDEITDACSGIGGDYHCNKCPIGKFNKYRCDIRGWLESECDT